MNLKGHIDNVWYLDLGVSWNKTPLQATQDSKNNNEDREFTQDNVGS